MNYYLGIDIGTYESKGVITDETGRVVCARSCAHCMDTPKPGYAEHDAEGVWWHDFCELSWGLLDESRVRNQDIAAVAVSAIAPCCLPVDKQMRPLRKAILYGVDVRAEAEIDELEARLGRETVLTRCGAPLSSQSAAAKVLWIKRHEPDVYAAADKFITSSTYLVAKLTGRYVIDHYTAAAWVPFYDVARLSWSDELLGVCNRDQLAQCHWTDEVVGTVHAQAAAATGLLEGTPVLTGTADAAAEAYSAKVCQPGDMLLMYGSSIFMIHVTDRLRFDERLWAGPYLFPGTYAVTAGMSCAGTLTRWFRDELAPDVVTRAQAKGENAYAALARLSENIAPGSEGLLVLPYFSGERTPINDPRAKGIIAGLTLSHTRAHLYHACLEGVGYGIGQHFDVFAEMCMETNRIVSIGGGTKNQKWVQIVSDITGREQILPRISIGAAYGDSLLAMRAMHGERPEADDPARDVLRVVHPDARAHERYAVCKEQYQRLYLCTKELMHESTQR